ncbi:hypothetical protein AR689_09765 [Arthrobacter sp. EpRS71]|nr:hypothetical protein AR689_09765 [Arthrobacter sp. EpRS71]
MRGQVIVDQGVPPAVTDDVGPMPKMRNDGRRDRLSNRVLFDGWAAVVNRIDLCLRDGCISGLVGVRVALKL